MDKRRGPTRSSSGATDTAPLTDAWPEGASLLVLSGGSSRRLGRDKATTHVGGRTLLQRLLADVPAHVPVVVAGPAVPEVPHHVRVVREDPPGSGPLAGIGAGLVAIDTPIVGVLAADMPFALPVLVEALRRLADADARVEAVLPRDPGDRVQQLCAAYRVPALRGLLAGLAPLAGRPVRAMLGGLTVMEWPVPSAALADVDTAEELVAARRRAREEGMGMQEWVDAVREALGLDVAVDLDMILDVARDAAHAVERPAAPVTTYLLGVAVARGADPVEVAATIARLAADRAPTGQ